MFLMKNIEKKLVNSKIQKVKQISRDSFSFELYKQKTRWFLVIVVGKGIFLTDKNYENRLQTDFLSILRKHLTNQIIQNVHQHEFDRIVEIETRDYKVMLEFFSNGNIILVNKQDGKIIFALNMRSWKDRIIKPKKEYRYPPSSINPFKLSEKDFKRLFGKKEVVKVLASDLGFGGSIAEDICNRCGVDKNSKNRNDSERIYKFLKNIEKFFLDFVHINERLKNEFKVEEFEKTTKTEKKLERIRKKQEKRFKELTDKEKKHHHLGEKIYKDYAKLSEVLDRVNKLRDSEVAWKDISEKLGLEISPKERKIVIDGVSLDLRKSLEKNADKYFQDAKKMKKKIEGLKKAMKDLEKKKFVEVEKKKKIVEKKPKEWYDKFRWFKSSDGFLVVSGKDAKTNERLIRKYMKPNDLVFHTDITGSPFVLIKNPDNKEIPEQTIREAAEFCASYSKAWKIDLSTADVYYVKPDQVKKEGGLPTGSFMIYGKREWVRRIELKVAIGIVDNEVVYGPESVVSSKIKDYILVRPGEEDVYDFLKNKFGSLAEKVKRVIPYGKCSLI